MSKPARAVFDLRIRVEGADPAELWRRAKLALELLREDAPDGVEPVRVAMRPASRSRGWPVNVEPAPRRRT